jgi:hypothetical protein
MVFMKKIYLLMILQILVFAVFAQKNEPVTVQKPEPVNPMKDKQEYQGYTIRLMPAMPMPGSMGSYGFDILKDNKPLVHQLRNPLPFSPKGIQKKDDAYKIAQWMIREYKNTGHWQNIVPPHIAHELKIESH